MNDVSVTPGAAQVPPTLGSIASRWRELQGTGSWTGLLDPIDADLRASVIAYGELAAAAYDGLNTERRSPNVGSCLYRRTELLGACGVSCPGHYAVTKFLYAPSGLVRPMSRVTKAFFVRPLREGDGWREVNWMGYVAVATDEGVAALGRRDIVVVWRGTVERLEALSDIFLCQASAETVPGPSTAAAYKDAKVHRGFLSVYTYRNEKFPHDQNSVKDQVLNEVREQMKKYKDEVTSITVTGHSLGASLATLNAVDMVANGVNVPPASSKQPPCPVTAILFASPRVGNSVFKAAFASFPNLHALNVRNDFDPVPSIPPSLPFFVCYEKNVGTEVLRINTTQSPYLRQSLCNWLSFWNHHNLEVYLHGVAGYHGAGREFSLVVNRDVELVNKWADLLTDEHLTPANWWVVQNKCMVRASDGHWKLDDFKED